jgi:large repetitive protein
MKPVFFSALLLVFTAPLFADWEGCSIGATSQSAIETYSANSFALTVSGMPLADTTDVIGFASGPGKISGNCEIVARLARISSGQQEWAAGGVIIRESISEGSKFVAVGCTHAHGVQSFVRSADSATVTHQENCAECNPPVWLKIIRSGNHFSVYRSTDGVVWLQVYETDVVMKKSAWVGVFATNGGGQPAATITFERVAAKQTGNP